MSIKPTPSIVSLLVLLLIMFNVISCGELPEEPIRLSSSPWPGYEPLYLARDLGYINESQVHIFELPSSDITMEAFRNRSTDAATLTLDETLGLLDEGTDLRIVLVLDISDGGDAVLAHPDIKKLSDIKGKRISIVNIPLGIYMLNRLLDKAGVSRSEVDVFPMAESKQLKFYQEGKADVVITFEPVKTLLKEAGAHVVFDSSMIPNEIFDLLVVHKDAYESHRAVLCHVANQWFKTLAYMKKNKEDAALKITGRLGLSKDDYGPLLDGLVLADKEINERLLGGNEPGMVVPARRLSEIMLVEQQLSKKIDVSNAIDPEFISCFK